MMNRRLMVMALAAVLGAAVLSPAFGYSAEVRERMMVRNLAQARLDDSVRPVVARDSGAGFGIFDYSSGPMGFGWPLISAGPDSLPYNVAMLDSSGCLLSRTRMPTWDVWDSVFDVASTGNQPMFETHNIAASPASNKVCITWVRTDTSPMPGHYRFSSDGGASWDSVQQLDWPPAYGADTVTSFHVSSLYPFYDDGDRLHVVAAVHPVVHDTAFIMPAEIWHWCPDNSPQWNRVHRAGCAPEHLRAPVGYNALYACRPSAFDVYDGLLFAVWEQFDSANVDSRTNLLRADIYASYGLSHGSFWDGPYLVAAGGGSSLRFPFPAPAALARDTVLVIHEVDQVAGFHVLGQGRATNNPIAALKVWLSMSGPLPVSLDTIGGTTYDLQTCGPVRTMVHDAPGYGVHAAWMWSEDTTGVFPDLNMRYNFYDYSSDYWNWTDPDFMQSGVNVFPYRTGLGCMDVDTSGVAVISACTPPPLPHVAVGESRKQQVTSRKLEATIVRGVLRMPSSLPTASSSLLSIDGREVMDLHPGANDVRALAPGVYFVRQAPGMARDASSVTKIVLTD